MAFYNENEEAIRNSNQKSNESSLTLGLTKDGRLMDIFVSKIIVHWLLLIILRLPDDFRKFQKPRNVKNELDGMAKYYVATQQQ